VDADSLDAGLRLFEQRQGLGAFDAVLVAAAVAADADAIVSADTDFADVPRLRYVQPGTDEFEELLSRT
jgi:predicted nucleic acid-binding protein